MRLSWKWLAEIVDLSSLSNPEALAELLTARGLEVEGIERQSQGLEKVITVEILERKPHPQADRLSLCSVSLGSGAPLEIVCGAQNMKAGDRVALAQIGAHLPNGMDIALSKIRGVVSNGMLCSETELKLAEESAGILILPSDTPLGRPLAEILKRDDVIFSLKLTANRGDCLSHMGIAREIAAALGKPVKAPKLWDKALDPALTALGSKSISGKVGPIEVTLAAGELGPQFCGALLTGVKVGPSPQWMVKRLETLGLRSINNVVDASNYVMLELGHPTHAYDRALIKGDQISVRKAESGESIPVLNGSTVNLTGDEIVIADGQRAVALAGVMGGANSEVSDSTRDLFLECAEFNASVVRRVSSKNQLKTDAAHRFERGIDSEALGTVMRRLIALIQELAGGQVQGSAWLRLPKAAPSQISFSQNYLSDFLGFPKHSPYLNRETVSKTLKGLGCKVEESSDGSWKITPPSYRNDLKIKQDIAEEMARSVGYDKIPATIPTLSSSPVLQVSSSATVALMDRAKDALKAAGLQEVVNYAFTSEAWLGKLGMKSQVLLMNPLSEECRALVPSLLPGLINNVIENSNRHFGSELPSLRLFELRPVFSVAEKVSATSQMNTGVVESWKLSLVMTGARYAEGLKAERGTLDFYDLKAVIEALATALGTKGMRLQALDTAPETSLTQLFHPGQSANILTGKFQAGTFGLLHPAIAQELKLRSDVWLAELDFSAWTQMSRGAQEVPSYKPWSAFPPMERDYALVVHSDVTVEKLCQVALKIGKPLARSAKVFDIYRGAQVNQGMTSVAVRVIFYHEDRNLQESEVEGVSTQIVAAWKKEFGAELR